jgi:tetratricopeptide (TPR) repeat protein
MSYVRCGNTGISGIINPLGQVVGILTAENGQAISVPGVLIGEVPVSTGRRTVYSVSRDLFAKLVLSITLLLWLGSYFRRPGRAGAVAATTMVMILALPLAGCGGGASIGNDPDVVPERIEAGNRAVREGRFGEAIPLFQDACATSAGCERVLEPIAVCFRSVRKIESGADFFLKVAEKYPELEGPALGQAGRFLEESLAILEARDAYERSLAVEASPDVYRRLGRLLFRIGSTAEAMSAYRNGLLLDPENIRLRYSLAQTLRQQGELDDSREIVEQLLDDNPDHTGAQAFLGQILYEQGQVERSRNVLENCLQLDPDNIQARFLMARFALREGKQEEFIRHLKHVLRVEETLGRGPRQED